MSPLAALVVVLALLALGGGVGRDRHGWYVTGFGSGQFGYRLGAR